MGKEERKGNVPCFPAARSAKTRTLMHGIAIQSLLPFYLPRPKVVFSYISSKCGKLGYNILEDYIVGV